MQKVYLLLRNNQQTGPFNIEELLKFDLKPFDLIWIEGKSAGWYYPQELKALHPYLPFVKQATPQPVVKKEVQPDVKPAENIAAKKVFVSMPVSSDKEAPLQKPSFHQEISEPFSSPYQAKQDDAIKTTYAKSLEEVEEDYTSWVYNQKTKKKPAVSKKGLLAACFIVIISFAGWWAVKTFSASTAKTFAAPESTASVQNEAQTDSSFQVVPPQNTSVKAIAKKKKENKSAAIAKTSGVDIKNAFPAGQPSETSIAKTNPVTDNDYEAATIKEEEVKTVVEEKGTEPVAEAPKEKKKLRDKIFDLFKKKPAGKNDEEAKPAEEESGERKTTRREGDASLAQLASVRFTIPNDWMMGIKTAKATFNNRSNEVVAKATVEVLYYNDDNELLDKKTLSFKNISAKGSQTVAVPDHASATRLESKIISVTGAEPYAKL